MCPSLCTSLARGLPLCVASSRAAMFPACTLPCPLVQPPPSLPSLSFSLQGPGRIGEPCTGCGAVSAAARRGLPRPGRCEQGGMGGPSLRFTLNPQNSPELEKCSIRSIGAADRPSAVGWGRQGGGAGERSPRPEIIPAATAESVPMVVGAGVRARLSLASTCTSGDCGHFRILPQDQDCSSRMNQNLGSIPSTR